MRGYTPMLTDETDDLRGWLWNTLQLQTDKNTSNESII